MMTTLAQSGFPEAMTSLTLYHYLLVSAVMFTLGLIGFITRRNLCTEMMFQASGIALIAFSRFYLEYTGQVFMIFVLTVAAAEAAMALALVVLLFKQNETLDGSVWSLLKG